MKEDCNLKCQKYLSSVISGLEAIRDYDILNVSNKADEDARHEIQAFIATQFGFVLRNARRLDLAKSLFQIAYDCTSGSQRLIQQ